MPRYTELLYLLLINVIAAQFLQTFALLLPDM